MICERRHGEGEEPDDNGGTNVVVRFAGNEGLPKGW